MAKPPGNDRMLLMGDKTFEFYRSPIKFISSRIKKYEGAKTFQQRFLNKQTIWLTSHRAVTELLYERTECFEPGYEALNILPPLFGSSAILFQSNDRASKLRRLLMQAFHSSSSRFNHMLSDQLLPLLQSTFDEGRVCDIYQRVKRALMVFSLQFYLDVDPNQDPELVETLINLSIEHWHGIISLPNNMRFVPFGAYKNALNAKDKLVEIIERKVRQTNSNSELHLVDALKDLPENVAIEHMLVFICALIPKALASYLTSTILALSSYKPFSPGGCLASHPNESEAIEALTCEVARLYPPFIGGRRVSNSPCELDGYSIAADQAVVYMSHFAQRDPDVFSRPNEFDPTRWLPIESGKRIDKSKLFAFGGGIRECIGRQFIDGIMHKVISMLNSKYSISSSIHLSEINYKWLPVSRPIEKVTVTFERI